MFEYMEDAEEVSKELADIYLIMGEIWTPYMTA